MRTILVGLFSLVLILPANARSYYRHHGHHVTHKYAKHLAWRHYRHVNRRVTYRGNLPAPCRVAASMGGPCGCWAAYVLLGRLDHVWRGVNLWLANDWLRFPHVAAAPGTAAVWPHRHVAPVVAVKGNTVIVRDSWAVHPVRMAGLVFVQPPVNSNRRTYKVAQAWPL